MEARISLGLSDSSLREHAPLDPPFLAMDLKPHVLPLLPGQSSDLRL